MKKPLFICNQGENRSKTAANIFNGEYAGIYSEKQPVTKDLLEEASELIVFEDNHIKWIAKNYPKYYLKHKITNLDIPDIYNYNNEKLIKELKTKVKIK